MERRVLTLAAMTTAVIAMSSGLLGSVSAVGAAPSARVPRVTLDPDQPASPPGPSQAPTAPSSSTPRYSTNWSGYAVTSSSTFKSVSTTYVQPAVSCRVAGAVSVFWVGLDGWNDGTVEQDGTGVLCQGSTPVYFAWWEMYPTNAIQPTMLVSAGDRIRDSVHYDRGQYILTVEDLTDHVVHTNVATCGRGLTCARSSAEWIVERPTVTRSTFARLADWGTMSLADDRAATTTGGPRPISLFANFGIDMVNRAGTRMLATVGGLNLSGNVFLDTWDAAR